MIATILALSILSRQTATLSMDGVDSVTGILAHAASALHIKLKADSEVAGLHVYARLSGVPLNEFETRLGQVSRATWFNESGTLVLRRTPEQRRQIESQRIVDLSHQIDRTLSTYKVEDDSDNQKLAAKKYATEIKAALAHPGPTTPIGPADTLLRRILVGFASKRLAALLPFRITLFSNKPTAKETELQGYEPALRQYKAASQALVAYLNDRSIQEQLDKYDFDRVVAAANKAASADRILLQFLPTNQALIASLAIYDGQGQLLTEALQILRLGQTEMTWPPEAEAIPISWPDLTMRALGVLGKADTPSALRADLETILNEPLKLQAIPGLQVLAGSKSPNILCPLPDEAVPALEKDRPKTTSDFEKSLASAGLRIRREDNWLLGDLSASGFDLYHYLDRQALNAYENATISGSQSWLRRTSAFYGHGGDAASNALTRWIIRAVWPPMHVTAQAQYIPRWALLVLGTLSDDEWKELESGRPVPAAVSQLRSDRIEQWSFSSITALDRLGNSTGPEVELIGSYSFPAGPPDSSTITSSQADEWIVEDETGEKLPWMTLGQLANWACETAVGTPTEQSALKTLTGRFNLARRPDTKIVVTLDSRFSMSCVQPSEKIELQKESVALSDWPSDLLDRLRAEIKGYLANRGRRSAPPP